MIKPRPTLFVLAGPNGAGKSTLYQTVIAPKVRVPFINADEIQQHEMTDHSVEASYKAAEIAAKRRAEYIANKKSFVTESTFSHPSKNELIKTAKANDFRVLVYHVSVLSPDLSVARVAARVKEGGHDVPEHKIRQRYERNQTLIKQAILAADKGFIFDNSGLNSAPLLSISFSQGLVDRVSSHIPEWIDALYQEELEVFIRAEPALIKARLSLEMKKRRIENDLRRRGYSSEHRLDLMNQIDEKLKKFSPQKNEIRSKK